MNRRLSASISKWRRKSNVERRIAYLGDGSGEVHDRTKPGNYWIRYAQGVGNLSSPVSLPCDVNANLPSTDGLAVEIGERHEQPIILGAHYEGLIAAGVNPLQLNPADSQATKFISQRQITTLSSMPHADRTNNPFYAVVMPGFYYDASGILQFFAGNSIDLSGDVPSSGDHCYSVVLLKRDGTLEEFASTAISNADPLTMVDIQEAIALATSGSLPIWAYELDGTDTVLSVDDNRQVDIRRGFSSGASGALPPIAHSSLTGLTTGDDHTQYALLAGRIGGQTLLGGLTLKISDSGTNAVINVTTVGHNTSGTAAAGFGTGLIFEGQSSTTADQSLGRLMYEWATATHASRKAFSKWTVFDTAEREGIRIEANGSATKIGFYGHASAAQSSAYTPTNVATDRSYDANSTSVDELADILGTLIADLQATGLIG